MSCRAIAFYLPQFYPIPENDRWWGTGFTEWTNVVRGRPLFPGHYQPHLPADLGFYDLRLPETRQAQADLAREHGIHGFCYYHYWFAGKRLLERPFNEVLASGEPDFPFCLCWANGSWNRAWDGQEKNFLIQQRYSVEDDRAHGRWLAGAFRDPRYIRVHGKPMFLVYQPSLLPDPIMTTSIWREEAARQGVGEIFLCRVESFQDDRSDPATGGFDAAVEFQPDTSALLTLADRIRWTLARRLRLMRGALVCSYAGWARRAMRRSAPPFRRFPCVTPSWDNSARRKRAAFTLHGSTPNLYAHWLQCAVDRATRMGDDENLVFINAWNEWGEGNHLEPCQKWGHGYLEATRRVLLGAGR